MTYKEKYMKCKTLNELKEVVKKDIVFASVINPDRVNVIKQIAESVCEKKFNNNNYS